MAKQTINIGSGELQGDGESIRSAFDKINQNFDELYNNLGSDGSSSDRLTASGDEVILTGGANPYTTFPAITGGDQLLIQGAEIASISGNLAVTSRRGLNVISNTEGRGQGGSFGWTFNAQGDIELPIKFPVQFTAVFDEAHYNGGGTFQGDGTISLGVQLQGQGAQFQWLVEDPTFNTDRGYVGQQAFRYTEADHGITGVNVDILVEVMGPDLETGLYSLQIAFSPAPGPADLAKIRSTDELIVSASDKGWIFDVQGNIYLPAGGDIRDSAGNSVIFNGSYSNADTSNDISFSSGDDITLQGKNLPGTDSEGGDINLYAGNSDPGNGGGDIAILGGHAGQLDGPADTGNIGGNITIGGGYGVGYTERGGNVTLQGGPGDYNNGGNILLAGGAGGPNGLKLSGAAVAIIENLNPVRVTFNTNHRLMSGNTVVFEGITTTTQLNNRMFYVSDLSDTVVDLYYDPDATIPVDGTGFTAYGTTVVTAINGNNESNNVFSEYTSNYPDLVNVIVGDLVSGVGIFGIKVVTSITEPTPGLILIHIDGTDGSVFVNTESYTFTRGGGGSAYSSAPGGSITVSAGQTFVDTYGVHGSINFNSGLEEWAFKQGGTTKFPTLTVPISDNANPSGTGQTLKFDDPSQQAIIYGPSSTAYFNSAERVIIQGAPGYTGTAGEGGDIYLWAGPGGSAGGDGGDIKIRAGRGQGNGGGGYLNFQAGNAGDGAGANGGWINIESGSSANGTGGNITIDANSGGNIDLYTAAAGVIRLNTAGGVNVWTFTDTGNLQVPNGTTIIHDGLMIGSEGSYGFIDIPNNANSLLNNGLRITNQNGPVSITSFVQPSGTVQNWIFNSNGDLELPGGSSLATSSYDVALVAGNDGNSVFGSVTINTQFPAAIYTVTQEGGMPGPGGFGVNTITGNISNSPSASSIVAGMTVTGLNLIGVTTVTSATVDMAGNFTIITDADEVDPFVYGEVYTFTSAEPQNRNWEFNSLGELALPQGGAIQETTVTNELWGTTTTSMTLVPGGAGNGTQRLEIYATGGGEGDHIHIRSGDQSQTDLFLGNDTQYFAVSASGANYIQARNGTASPSPGISAGPGANVNIYAGSAGDNGGNAADGNSGGDVFISSGISTSGLGGDILINTSSGPDGFGSIELSTDGGSSNWTFNEANQLIFPDGTIQTTAYTGNVGTIDITDTNGLTTTYYPTFIENRTTEQYVRADVNLTYRTDTNTLGIGSLSFSGEPLKLVSTAPSSSTGTTGDKKGNIHYGHEYFYYCIANYAGGGKEVTVQASNTTFVHINKSDYPNLETLKSGNPGTWTITDGTNTYNINSVTTSGLIADAWELQLAVNPDPDFANGSTAVINASSYTYPIWRRLQWSTLPW